MGCADAGPPPSIPAARPPSPANHEALLNQLSSTRASRTLAVAAALGLSLAAVGGCDKGGNSAATQPSGPSASGERHTVVGVVDINKIITTNNWAVELNNDQQVALAELKRQAESYMNQLNAQMSDLKARVGRAAKLTPAQVDDLNRNQNLDALPLTAAQKQELGVAIYAYQQAARGVEQQAQSLLNARQQQITAGWVNAMQPVIRRVAEAKKVNVVFRKVPNNIDIVVWHDDSVEITNPVIDELAKGSVQRPPNPPLPKLELQPVNLTELPKAPTTAPAVPAATAPAR